MRRAQNRDGWLRDATSYSCACPLGEAACSQTPEAAVRRMLSHFARYKLDLKKSWLLQREKLRKMALMVKYPG
jgi:hypothetical protein